ncbi:YdeI/OmpD-associated family protein [Spongiivirga citrea]|uniref:YdhG-like domain-containing protein n=1 Tax=Spongiivirga citrea TaxID=1481457 RepID=A0A6M0CF44_9FLAO|nr:DUF1801 domain-containing protein [Spongiivirga citrea]NER16052.1 hypothetical protein [Spongiivirga citrea]
MDKAEKLEAYFKRNLQWGEELYYLRSLLNQSELTEDYKWNFPVYTLNNKNVIGLGAFKAYVGLWFFQGSFLKDEHKVLINAQEGKTKGLRQWRFTGKEEMDEALIVKYIAEAIQNQKDGKEIKIGKKSDVIPEILAEKLAKDKTLQTTFNALKAGQKREFIEYINEAKREATKLSRLEKIIPMILSGVGLHDKYK